MKKKFYITTAIAYPNSRPHCGHAIEIIQADVIARFHRLLGENVWFQTGTDEHGLKNWQSAQKQGKEILEFLDQNVAVFKDLYSKLNISYDYFVRTSDKKIHYPGVIKLWKELVKSGDLYKKNYRGLYCTGCEAFKTEKELENGKCPNHPTRNIEVVEEENYFFKLSKYREQISKTIESDELKVIPEIRKNEILSFLKIAEDISFSRPKTSLPWGIPVPDDEKQNMYVWCDALSNYITGIGYGRSEKQFKQLWPADVEIIGKDILRFHAAFWPAMLISAKIALPKQLFVHGFILSKGTKMGKSTGNIIEPFEQIKKFGAESFRFYLVGVMPLGSDGEYSEELLVERINKELVANLSNFCYRVLSFLNKNFDGEVKGIDNNKELIGEIEKKAEEVKKYYENYNFNAALNELLAISALGNKYFQDNEPWKVIKEDKEKAHKILGLSVNIVKNLSILIEPVLPEFSSKLQKQLNLSGLKWKNIDFSLKKHKIGKEEILVTKIDKEEIKKEEKFEEIKYEVDEQVKEIGLRFGVAQINNIGVRKKSEGLEKLKKETETKIKNLDLSSNKIYLEAKKLYNNQNFEPPFAHLIKLIKEKGRLPTINTVVDSYNAVSVKHLVSAGAHDVSKIKGKIRFVLTNGSEKYVPLGGNQLEKVEAGEYACVDDEHILCRLDVKQSEYTKADENTKSVMVYVQCNKGNSDEDLKNSLNQICENITKFCGGSYKILEEGKSQKQFPLNLKVAKILNVENHPNADKLYILQIDLGTEKRQLVAGLKWHYSNSELLNKKIIVITNLKHAKLRGVESQGMLLAGDDGEHVGVLTVDKSEAGDKVYIEGYENATKELDYDEFAKLIISVKNNHAVVFDKELKTDKELIRVEKVRDGGKVR